MKADQLEISVSIQIAKPVHEVFEAIADPAGMTNYFISESSGRMEEGRLLVWKFQEFDAEVPVRVGKVEQDSYISYYWDNQGTECLVEIKLAARGANATVVTVTETGMTNNEAGINWLKGNTEGWANFLACLKAWVEYSINLRMGAFDYRFDE